MLVVVVVALTTILTNHQEELLVLAGLVVAVLVWQGLIQPQHLEQLIPAVAVVVVDLMTQQVQNLEPGVLAVQVS
jgi:hypothetical protein